MRLFERKWVRVTGALLLVLVALVGAGAGWIAVDLASRPTPPEPTPEEMYAGEAEPARSTLVQAMHLFREEKYNQARQLWLPLAKAGNAEAQFRMGRLYGFGHGVQQNYEEEARWYRLAVAQDHPFATYNLGGRIVLGQLEDNNLMTAKEMFLKGANIGLPKSELRLYFLYIDPNFPEYNPYIGKEWLFKSACRNHVPSYQSIIAENIGANRGIDNYAVSYYFSKKLWENRETWRDYIISLGTIALTPPAAKTTLQTRPGMVKEFLRCRVGDQ